MTHREGKWTSDKCPWWDQTDPPHTRADCERVYGNSRRCRFHQLRKLHQYKYRRENGLVVEKPKAPPPPPPPTDFTANVSQDGKIHVRLECGHTAIYRKSSIRYSELLYCYKDQDWQKQSGYITRARTITERV